MSEWVSEWVSWWVAEVKVAIYGERYRDVNARDGDSGGDGDTYIYTYMHTYIGF